MKQISKPTIKRMVIPNQAKNFFNLFIIHPCFFEGIITDE